MIYDSASQAQYQHQKGMQVNGEVSPQFHVPANDQPQLTDLLPGHQRFFFRLNIQGSDVDNTLNKLTELSRPIDGTDQQAGRFYIDGDVEQVRLKMQPDGATNTTYYNVVFGHIDALNGLFSEVGEDNGIVMNGRVDLTCEPLGEGDSIALRNDLASSPHFIEDSNSDGLADGLTSFGAPTLSIGTGRQLIGSHQRMDTDAATAQGFDTDTVTCGAGVDVVAYFWVYEGSSLNDPLTLLVIDGGSNILGQTDHLGGAGNPTGYDKTATDDQGGVWYRYSFAVTTVAANVRMRVNRTLANATAARPYLVDGFYLEIDQTVIPNAWCSSSSLENRNDTATGATESQINYIDVWGIPGDAPAILQTQNDMTGGGVTQSDYIMAMQTDGKHNVAGVKHWVENNGGIVYALLPGEGTQITNAAPARTAGDYLRHTAPASDVVVTATADPYSLVEEAAAFFASPRRVFAIIRCSSASSTIEIANTYYGSVSSEPVSVNATNTWELRDLGLITPAPFDSVLEYTTAVGAAGIDFEVSNVANATFDIDAIMFLPVSAGFMMGAATGAINSALVTPLYTIGKTQEFFSGNSPAINSTNGDVWTVASGERMTRMIFVTHDVLFSGSYGMEILDTWEFTLTITPRTRHLLGTL
ncbi:MAG: hypothetical protein GY938_12730 [Ketobacter sp.]|nr:hypothetical protein [Ketobacter sp.]